MLVKEAIVKMIQEKEQDTHDKENEKERRRRAPWEKEETTS